MRNELDLSRPNILGWRPRSLFTEIQRTMDRALNDVLDDFPEVNTSNMEISFAPTAEVEEADSYFLAKFDIPGIPKEDVKIEIRDNTLYVSGERKEEINEKRGTSKLRETRYGRFERAFALPSKVDDKKVEASYNNGVLTVYLHKMEAAKGTEIKIGEGRGFLKNLLAKGSEKEAMKVNSH